MTEETSHASQRDGVEVELSNLTLSVGARDLLANISTRFAPGKITLIVGPSGAGKSQLLRVIAGLSDLAPPEVKARGSVRIGGREQLAERSNETPVGVVFQSFALFDELSPKDNVRFAISHRATRVIEPAKQPADGEKPVPPPPAALELLEELAVPTEVRTASLSGGQRQRLAIARTLAYDPQVILYDEPTSGLDSSTARQVAELIATAHAAHGKTSIIVTHDTASLAPIADEIFLLDPETRSLREIDHADWERLPQFFHPTSARNPAEIARAAPPRRVEKSFTEKVRNAVCDFFVGTSKAAELVLTTPLRLIPTWRSAPWGFRFFLHYLRLVANPTAWAYLAVAGVIVGFVSTYFTFRFLPFRSYTEPLVIEDLLTALGFTLYRILVPVFATLLIAARCGAAVASDVGNKRYGQQVEALRTFGANPHAYLMTGILWAFLVGTPFLVGICYYCARLVSLIVFSTTHSQFGPFVWSTHYHRRLYMPGELFYEGSWWLLAKLLLCAIGTGALAYDRGIQPKYSGRDVSDGITSAILWATLWVLSVHFVFAFIEFPPAAGNQ